MSFWKLVGRRQPYTSTGIRRVPCVRCGNPALHQWNVCADGNRFRALCLDCDIALNKLVLEWANDPGAAAKVAQYEVEQRAKA
jgi:hypothetical protein